MPQPRLVCTPASSSRYPTNADMLGILRSVRFGRFLQELWTPEHQRRPKRFIV
jgi:hypothetical protein